LLLALNVGTLDEKGLPVVLAILVQLAKAGQLLVEATEPRFRHAARSCCGVEAAY
jgi:hypothetical protein